MCHFNFEIPELQSEEILFAAQQHPQVLDWFILEGGQHDEEMLPQEELHEVRLDGIPYFIGFPTCYKDAYYEYVSDEEDYDDCVIEIAALAVQGAPYSNEFLETLIEPVQIISDNHFIEIDIIEDLEGMVWVCRRFTKAQLNSDDFYNMMGYFVGVTKEVRTAVFSDWC
jgi:hypothetical protein